MGYTYSFSDDTIYGAMDVNKITSKLVTSGVEDIFTNGVPYNASMFNRIAESLSTSGAIPVTSDSLKVTSESATKIKILPGTAFFDNGMTMEVDSKGVSLSFKSGKVNYVFLKYDEALGTCYPVCSESAPQGGDIPLAKITATGEIQDKRKYAKGKLPGYMSDFNLPKIIENVTFINKGTYTFDVDGDKRQLFIFIGRDTYGSNNYINVWGMWSVWDNKYYSWINNDTYVASYENFIKLCSGANYCGRLFTSYEGRNLICTIKDDKTPNYYEMGSEFTILAF